MYMYICVLNILYIIILLLTNYVGDADRIPACFSLVIMLISLQLIVQTVL